MRDDISKVPIPQSSKTYARMSGRKWLGPAKPKLFVKMTADIANGGNTAWSNRDAAGTVRRSFREDRAAWVVRELLDD